MVTVAIYFASNIKNLVRALIIVHHRFLLKFVRLPTISESHAQMI